MFDNFQVFDITDPTAPTFAGSWGAERLSGIPDVQNTDDVDVIIDAVFNPDYGLLAGYGSSANRFLHDITVTADGTLAYLSNWDAGLVLLDLADVADPQVVSVARDVDDGSLDGEVNSHAAWPSEAGWTCSSCWVRAPSARAPSARARARAPVVAEAAVARSTAGAGRGLMVMAGANARSAAKGRDLPRRR